MEIQKMGIITDLKDKEQNPSLKIWYLRHHVNKETSQANIKFGCDELNSFKKNYGDFESIRTKRQLSHHKRFRSKILQQTDNCTHSDNFTPSGIRLMKNEPFV